MEHNYTIYIANRTGSRSSAKDKMKPSGNKRKGKDDSKIMPKIARDVKGFMTNPVGTAIDKLSKVFPVVSLGVMAVGLAKNITDKTLNLMETITGEYKYVSAWTNAKKVIGNIMNPIGYFLNSATENVNREHQKMTYEENLKCMGGFIGGYNI